MQLEGKIIKNKMKQLIYVLFLTSCLLIGNFASIPVVNAQETTMYKTFMKTPQALNLDTIGVEKTVWDNISDSWSESTIVPEGEIVVFNVSIYNPYDEYFIHFGGKVIDILPCNLQYINGSSTIYEESGWPNLEEVYWEENKVVWPQAPTIYPHEYLNFTYAAQAITCGLEFLKNNCGLPLQRPIDKSHRNIRCFCDNFCLSGDLMFCHKYTAVADDGFHHASTARIDDI